MPTLYTVMGLMTGIAIITMASPGVITVTSILAPPCLRLLLFWDYVRKHQATTVQPAQEAAPHLASQVEAQWPAQESQNPVMNNTYHYVPNIGHLP